MLPAVRHRAENVAQRLYVEMMKQRGLVDWQIEPLTANGEIALPYSVSPFRVKISKTQHLKVHDWFKVHFDKARCELIRDVKRGGSASARLPCVLILRLMRMADGVSAVEQCA